MRIRKRRPAAEGSCCQNDAAAGASNGGDSGDYINPPNFSSATHDMIPPSCSLLSQRQPHALLAGSSVTGAGPAATPSTAVEDSTVAMWGRSSEPRVSTVLMSKEEEMEQKAMITITENVHRKYGGKPSKLTSAKISVVRADDGMKPGCKKAKELNAVRRKKDLLSSNMVVELKPDSQKVLPLDLILNSKPPSNNVWKSSCSNRQVQVARQGLVISNDTGKPAQEEEDHNTPSETQAPTTRTTTKLHPQIGILERRSKSGKGRTTIIRRDTSWLLSSLKGHRRARSYVMPRKSRSNIWGSARRNYDAWAEVGGFVVGHNSAGAKLAMESKETAPAFLSAEPAKEKDVEHEMDQSRRPIEKKKSAKVMKKKEVPRVNDSVAVASIMINAGGKLKKTKTLKTETLKTMKKKKKRSSEVEEQVVDLERCKRRDGRGWQCRKPVMRPGATYCEYHMLKMTESHARNTEQLTSLKMQGEPNNRKRRRKSIVAGEELRGVEGDGDAKTAGGEQAALLRRRRWRKKCKPCIRRLHEIEERAKPVEEASVSACASTSSLERHAKHHHPHLPECLLNTDPREWRSDLLSR